MRAIASSSSAASGMAVEAGPRTYGQDLELLRDLLRTQGTARRKQYLRNFLRDQDGFARGIWREAVRNHPDISDDAFLEKFFLTFEQHRRKGLNVVAVARDDATWYGPYGPHSHEPELSTVSRRPAALAKPYISPYEVIRWANQEVAANDVQAAFAQRQESSMRTALQQSTKERQALEELDIAREKARARARQRAKVRRMLVRKDQYMDELLEKREFDRIEARKKVRAKNRKDFREVRKRVKDREAKRLAKLKHAMQRRGQGPAFPRTAPLPRHPHQPVQCVAQTLESVTGAPRLKSKYRPLPKPPAMLASENNSKKETQNHVEEKRTRVSEDDLQRKSSTAPLRERLLPDKKLPTPSSPKAPPASTVSPKRMSPPPPPKRSKQVAPPPPPPQRKSQSKPPPPMSAPPPPSLQSEDVKSPESLVPYASQPAHETKLYAENDVKLDVKLDDPMDDGDVEGKAAAEEDPVRSELGNADSISPSDAGAFDAGDQKEIYYHGQEDEVGPRQGIAQDEQGEIESQYHEEVENQDQGEVENQDHGEIENQDLEKEAQNLDQQGDQEDIQDRESQEKIFDTSSTAKEEMDYAQVQGSASDHDREELELSEADAVGQEPKGTNELPEEGPVLSKDAEVSEEAPSTSPKNEGNEGETEYSARVEIAESQELRDQQDQQLKVDAMNETNSNCLDHVEDTEGEAQKDTDAENSADGVDSIDGGAAISATMQQVEIENNDKSALANEATEMGACEAELDENALTHPVPETGGLDEIETSAVFDVKSTEAAMESVSEGGQTEDPLAKQATVVESSIERESGSALHAETHDAVSEAVQGNEGKENGNEESKVHVEEDASESSPMGGQDPATMEVIDGTSFDNGATNDMHRSVVADTNDAQELQIAAGDVSTQPADDATDKGALRKEDGADDATSTAGKNEEEGEQNFASEESVVADPNEEPPAHRERSSEAVQADHSTIEETKDQGAELKKYEEEAGVYAVTDEVAEKNCPDNDDARVAEGENSESSFPQVSADVEVLKDPKETKQDIISPSEGAPADMAGSAEDCEFANALADVDSVETPPEVQNVEKGIPSEIKAEADFEGEEYVEVECKDEDGVTTHGDDADAALTVSAAQAKEEVGIATKESVLEPTTAPEDETDGCKAEEAFEPQTDSPADYPVSAEEDGAYAIENLAGEQQEYEQLEEEAKTGQEYRAASAATERAPTEAIEKPQSAPDYAPPRSQEGLRVDKAANDGQYQWYEVYDEGSGYMYYQHAVTGETQWEPPAEGYVPYQYPEDEAYDGGAGEDAQQEIGAGEEGWAADGTLASEGDQREDEAVEPQRPTRASFYSIDM